MRICLARLSTIFHDRNVSQVEPFFCRPLAAIIVTLLTVGAASGQTDPLDWPYWRGPESNGISRETGLPETFNPKGGAGSMVAWEQPALGSRSTPVVLNGRLYTICRAEPGTARKGEKVVCADAKTGEILWENRFNVYLSDVPAERVGWSAVVGDPETGKVYVLGVCGLFSCIDGETGKTLWSVPLHERFGLLSTYGGRTNYPVICEDLVIVSAVVIGWGENARPCHQFIGLNKETGDVVWFNGTQLLPDDTTYSAPVVTVLNGQKAMVFGSGDGAVWAFQPRTGRHIWRYQFSQRGLNVSPTIDGDTVYMGQSEENVTGTTMGAVVAIDGNSEGDISDSGATWKVERLMVGKSSPLLVGDRLYVVEDSAKLHVLDPKTGDTLAKRIALGTMMRSNLLYADGKIYATEANGRWYIMKPDEKKGVQFLAKGRLPAGEECHGSPICSHGR
ncbi:MAG: PQQ-like beta-propeller repeat protein, partial [Planctomycetales bacterium]|nr:PQQ-like beta-propeller repeat protein [Planctomycetales bacterium]